MTGKAGVAKLLVRMLAGRGSALTIVFGALGEVQELFPAAVVEVTPDRALRLERESSRPIAFMIRCLTAVESGCLALSGLSV